MRLATVFDTDFNESRPVFELPGGERVELRQLFRVPGVAETLSDMPVYFEDLTRTVQHLDDVVSAARAWAEQRAENATSSLASVSPSRTTQMPFCAPIPAPRSVREFSSFEQHVRAWREWQGMTLSPLWKRAAAFRFGSAESLIGHQAAVAAPQGAFELDFGFQIAAVIGRGGRNISQASAWKHVAGFTIVNRFVARDIEKQELAVGFGPGKSSDFATAAGPYLVTIDALRDRLDLEGNLHVSMSAKLNGKEISRGNAATMSFTWPTLIETASRDAELHAGDMILSGTMSGGSLLELRAGSSDGAFLRPGDVIELEVERLGTLRTPLVSEDASTGDLPEPHTTELAGA